RLRRAVAHDRFAQTVVDIRQNYGGDIGAATPVLGILETARVRARPLYVITGRNTFFAASLFAAEIERATRAIFVGEPMGGSPNLYGDSRAITLPYSGIVVEVSTVYHVGSTPNDPGSPSRRSSRRPSPQRTTSPAAIRQWRPSSRAPPDSLLPGSTGGGPDDRRRHPLAAIRRLRAGATDPPAALRRHGVVAASTRGVRGLQRGVRAGGGVADGAGRDPRDAAHDRRRVHPIDGRATARPARRAPPRWPLVRA